jgi:hypothetical protein
MGHVDPESRRGEDAIGNAADGALSLRRVAQGESLLEGFIAFLDQR